LARSTLQRRRCGVKGAKQGPVLDALIEINRPNGKTVLSPSHVSAEEDTWRPVPSLEFYVDFETVSDLDDDFSNFPPKGGQPLIFMIGCGHIENGDWRFHCFTSDALTEPAEEAIIDTWLDHMKNVKQLLAPRELRRRLKLVGSIFGSHSDPLRRFSLIVDFLLI